ncbi:probable NADH dehydrogenase [ubiquinone] 1 alpha subcomplex subunit 12 [Bactrocera neohumeralis]|uniref:probable NADH dehydrogenase [ubiquinone] 1 alpha subcomplex subunit 12 n=1 Tax=Bactrocera tryoni TaxID=59916 RepID=UPI001A97AB58|nr:probable NADH dehydrogenase [ubiquinone] 1 alpha subcomplex subunit 12 [Bactrocera tryoni]XP_039949260.1 probable NADH dehydrogenase [ubiquinone] 1 alpha subcomplex subunit 12 [Bactrocera tryoni]XP_050318612.1 probable NADH dehydrogenase [ubiquinone] 1 alpha subcomplex subunit 12 [Bactrocera neohumeralis]XP_050318613.1 probable NADH dehydrogenase [ubiquinone] 1 alpha subcomplex subunit 12 [Bactrocera neohumeralis]
MAKYLGLDRLGKIFQIIRQSGGIKNAYMKMYRYDDLKIGTLVGTDKYGNRYYENPYYFYGRNRWVEYADHLNLEYDGSQIPADWYGWMHYKTDLPPIRDGSRPKYKWMADHSENLSGTKEQYMPYSTTPPKVQAWDPKKSK